MAVPDQLRSIGQHIWLDYMSRDLLDSGKFDELRAESGISGVTANPTIYAEALTSTSAYDETIRLHQAEPENRSEEAFWEFAVEDIQRAADTLRRHFIDSGGMDGLVSLEVSPRLAYDAEATIDAASELFERIDRPNAMVKVPGTRPGNTAIEELTAAGVNVNVTLLFDLEQWQASALAFRRGIERRLADVGNVDSVVSVASFFLSRVDAKANPVLPDELQNQLAIAAARLAYEAWSREVAHPDWKALEHQGARMQQLLWASTSPKSETLDDTYYVERLIAPQSVVTVPIDVAEALNRLRELSQPRLDRTDVGSARDVVEKASERGAGLEELAEELQEEGVEKFDASFTELLEAIDSRLLAGTTAKST